MFVWALLFAAFCFFCSVVFTCFYIRSKWLTDRLTDHLTNMLTLVATVTKQIKQANSENKNILFCLPFQSIVVIFVAFLPHDAMQARPMLSCSVCLSICLSVRLSVTFVNSVKTSIFNFFSPSGSQTIVVIALPNIMAIFRRDPP